MAAEIIPEINEIGYNVRNATNVMYKISKIAPLLFLVDLEFHEYT
jgi:hypothetical protein